MAIFSNNVSIANDGELIGGGIEWQAVKTASFTAVAGEGYFVNTTSAAITVTLPSSPSIGDTVAIKDYAGTFSTNNLTIGRNSENIQGNANDSVISTNRASIILVYVDATKGWLYTVESNVADFGPLFISATGGTITTSGDYKIHTFTGDGCFVVSCGGNAGGSNTVDYLVVAGGGGGAAGVGGGGGAGGYRESSGTASGCYTASPLGACVSALPVTAQGYPITVGGGGSAAGPGPNESGSRGSDSIFSSITSTGGGGGIRSATLCAAPGGSGGGAQVNTNFGTGNTPPVSPSQGFPGGLGGRCGGESGGGGGGATAVGSNGDAGPTPNNGGNGGAGATSSINATPTARAGGGGGSGFQGTGGSGGTGGGGASGPSPGAPGVAGTTNTGGGGGSGNYSSGFVAGGAGGKGIVIIRYKFQ